MKVAGVEAERERAKADLEAAEKAISALDHEIAAIAPAAPPRGCDPLAFIDAWRVKRSEALTLVEALRRSEDVERRAEDRGERIRERLCAALRLAGVAHDQASDLEALIEAAELTLSGEAQFAALRQKAEERRAESCSRRGQAQESQRKRTPIGSARGVTRAPARGLAKPRASRPSARSSSR